MQGDQLGFESSFRQHLDGEQRRAVLESLRRRINPDSTLGEVLDAAESLGWGDKLGDLSLADLADALLAPEDDDEDVTEAEAASDEDAFEDEDEDEDEGEDEDEDDEDEDEEPVQATTRRKTKATRGSTKKKAAKKKAAKKKAASKKASAKKTSSKKASSKKASSKKASSKKASSKKASAKKASSKKASAKKTSSKKASKGKGKRVLTAVDVDDRMSLDQAAEFFVPYVEELGEATMQALEEVTGVARRKLRFHIGQLVRHDYLERHGMGRGTYYTVV